MINLIYFIVHQNHINIYFDQDGYWINEIDWNGAIYNLGGMDKDFGVHEYLYNVAAGELCKEIYIRTQAEELRMFCIDGKIKKYVWSADIGAYYHNVSRTLIR